MDERTLREREYWDTAADDEQVDIKYIADVDTTACVDLILDAIGPLLSGDRILDLGCGVGRLTIPIKNRYPSAHVVGLDISQRMIEIAYARSIGVDPPVFCVGNGRTIDLPPQDAVYSMLLFQHLPPEAVGGYIKEVGKVLKPGGVFFFQYIEGDEAEPFSWHYHHDMLWNWCHGYGLMVEDEKQGLVHEQWSWVTAVKIHG